MYFLLLRDDFSRMMWCANLKNKLDAFEAFEKFKSMVEVEKDLKIACLRTDQRVDFPQWNYLIVFKKESMGN